MRVKEVVWMLERARDRGRKRKAELQATGVTGSTLRKGYREKIIRGK